MGLVDDLGKWRDPEAVVERTRGDAGLAETLDEYRARREKIPDTAPVHWRLAEWCEQEGLEAEAAVHLKAVVRLDPTRQDAWKKLGYRKQDGRWTTSEQVAAERAEADARRKADARWRPLLRKWKGWLGQKTKRAEAERALAGLDDPRAVPSIWGVFATGGPDDQDRAVLLLRQFDSPVATRALATLAVIGTTAEVRRLAAESLAGRDPREFAVPLIGLLRDPVKYEVRQVMGPGMPGELYIEGERANIRRFYEAPPPLATMNPGDVVGFDAYGLPIVNRAFGYGMMPVAAAIDPQYWGAPDLTGAPDFLARTKLGEAGRALGQKMVRNQKNTDAIAAGLPGGFVPFPLMAQVPVGQLMVMAERQAEFSRQRLEKDVAELVRYNVDVEEVNDRAMGALKAATGENPGSERGDWVKWWTRLAETVSSASPAPRGSDRGADSSPVRGRARVSSLGEETPVRTLSGLRPIENLRAGDKVLTQDTASGALGFVTVETIRRVAGEPVKAITLGDEEIVATDLERLWVAGKGWVMARDLKPGDAIRALGGVVRVSAVADAGTKPVCHVQVAEGRGIFVGRRGILAHDDRMARPVTTPFDLAAGAASPGRGARAK